MGGHNTVKESTKRRAGAAHIYPNPCGLVFSVFAGADMPDTRRITMRQIKDVLRLKLELHYSHQHIAASLGISKGVVTKYVKLASTAGLHWPQIQAMDETALHSRLMGAPQRASSFVTPDYAQVRQELQRKGMTLMLLWQEHSEQHQGEAIHSYSQFCENYRRFAKTLKRSMRQIHRAGEKLFIDYAGPTVGLTDASRAHIFVSALGASGYTFAYATPRETMADWLGATAQALRFYGGSTELIVPDIDDRAGNKASIITSQLPIEHWHAWIGDATIADAILDRVMQKNHRFNLMGESLRANAKSAKSATQEARLKSA
jgi:transposase